jgi:hypothetical protein
MPKMPGAAAMPRLVTILIVATRRNQSQEHLQPLFMECNGAMGSDENNRVRAYLIVLAASYRSS